MVPDATTGPGRVGVVGAGTMGAGIAQVALEAGDAVALYDVVPGAVEQARARIADGLTRRASKLGLDDGGAEAWVSARIGRLEGVGTLEAVAQDAFLVIEAAVEDLALKRVVFATLDAQAPTETILATNTSALPGGLDRRATRRAGRASSGLHFFNPAPVMPLVEVVVGRETDAGTADRAEAVVERWGKTPIRCADSPGFVVNRINRPFTLEPLRLLEGGTATIEEIDGAMRARGLPAGPVRAHRPDRPRRQPRHLDRRARRPGLTGAAGPVGAAGPPRGGAPPRPQAGRRVLRVRRLGPPGPPGPGLRPPRWQARAAAAGGDRRAASGWPSPTRRTSRSGTASPRRTGSTSRSAWAPPIRRGRSSGPSPRASTRSTRSCKALEAAEGERFAPAPALVEAAATR